MYLHANPSSDWATGSRSSGRMRAAARSRLLLSASTSRRRLLIVGGTAGTGRARRHEPHSPASSIVRAGRGAPRLTSPGAPGAHLCMSAGNGLGLRLVTAATGFAHSTVWKVLHRAGISRLPPDDAARRGLGRTTRGRRYPGLRAKQLALVGSAPSTGTYESMPRRRPAPLAPKARLRTSAKPAARSASRSRRGE